MLGFVWDVYRRNGDNGNYWNGVGRNEDPKGRATAYTNSMEEPAVCGGATTP